MSDSVTMDGAVMGRQATRRSGVAAEAETGMAGQTAEIRERAGRTLFALIWLHVPVVAAAAWLNGKPVAWLAGAAALLAGIALAERRLDPGCRRSAITISVVLMSQIALITAALAGHRFQVDSHMYFFAALALVATLLDMRAIVAGAALVAVHHALLNFAAPQFVYPGGGDVARLAIHAVVLSAEAVALLWFVNAVAGAEQATNAALEEAGTQAARAEEALAEVRALESGVAAERAKVMEELGVSIGSAVAAAAAGEFSHRIEATFEDAGINRLAEGVNGLLGTVESGLEAVSGAIRTLSGGDLTAAMQGEFSGTFATLRDDIDETVGNLRRMIADVQAASAEILQGAGEISGQSEDLSQRSTVQAAAIEETTATVNQVSETVSGNAGSAEAAYRLAEEASARAGSGSEVVSRTIGAMQAIEESAQRITEIVAAIDAIAFQTNLLALNASVEAARAGDAGKGFAVVAGEVRTLAGRAADAANDIRGLIAASGERISEGVKLASEAGGALDSLVGAISDVSERMGGISDAGQSLATSFTEIAGAVAEIEEATGRNAEVADTSAEGARRLAEQARRLETTVAFFRIGDGATEESTVPADAATAPARAAGF